MRTKMFATLTLAAALPALAGAGAASLDAVLVPYEGVRQALVDDSLEAAKAKGAELQKAVAGLDGLTAAAAGVPEAKLAEVRALVPELEKAAAGIAGAKDLAAARDAFDGASGALIAWTEAAGDGPAVAHCPMAKRSWLQDADEPIGNPYYGQSMARCGSIVKK